MKSPMIRAGDRRDDDLPQLQTPAAGGHAGDQDGDLARDDDPTNTDASSAGKRNAIVSTSHGGSSSNQSKTALITSAPY